MLDDFMNEQNVAYNIMVNEIRNKMVSHAYLIDENGNQKSFDMVMAFVKAILCEENRTSNKECINCSLCKRIDDGNYPEVKVITADGMYIKKKQVIDLQQEFSRSSVEGSKRIYIIRDCDKMRAESANAMLKFLEEPDNNIIAILMTNNYNNILPTIISRCQVIKLNGHVSENTDLDNEKIAMDFIYSIEMNGIDTILNINELWTSNVGAKDRDKMILIFDIMIDIYYDILKVMNGMDVVRYKNYIDKLTEIGKNNRVDRIIEKINYLVEAKDSIKYNVNSNLLIDSLVVNIGGSYEGSWN